MMPDSHSSRDSLIQKKTEEWNEFYFDYMNWKLFSVYMNRTASECSPQILEKISGIYQDDDEACSQIIFPFLSDEEKMQVRLEGIIREHGKDSFQDARAFTNIPAEFTNIFSLKIAGQAGGNEPEDGYGVFAGQRELLTSLSGAELTGMLDALEISYKTKAGKDRYAKLFSDSMNTYPEYYLYLFTNDEYDILDIIENMYGFGLLPGNTADSEEENVSSEKDASGGNSGSTYESEEVQREIACIYGFSTLIKKLLCLGLADVRISTEKERKEAVIFPAADAWKILLQLRVMDRVEMFRRLKGSEDTERKLSRLRKLINSMIK